MWPYGPSPFGPITSPCKASNGISCEIHKLVDLNIFKVLRGESCGMLAEYADWGTPASLLHRMNGAAVFAASVCSNSTVPTWVMARKRPASGRQQVLVLQSCALNASGPWKTQLYTNVIECGICITVHVCFHMLSLSFIVFWGDLMTHRSHKDFDLADLSGSVESCPWFKVLHTKIQRPNLTAKSPAVGHRAIKRLAWFI